MKIITAESIIVRAANLLATDIDEETILMSVKQGKYFGMEQTSRRIWEIIETPHNVAEIISLLAEEYRVDSDVCGSDVMEFLHELLLEELVVVK
jgi:hypothetical protein